MRARARTTGQSLCRFRLPPVSIPRGNSCETGNLSGTSSRFERLGALRLVPCGRCITLLDHCQDVRVGTLLPDGIEGRTTTALVLFPVAKSQLFCLLCGERLFLRYLALASFCCSSLSFALGRSRRVFLVGIPKPADRTLGGASGVARHEHTRFAARWARSNFPNDVIIDAKVTRNSPKGFFDLGPAVNAPE
jgi:hypothetical protein